MAIQQKDILNSLPLLAAVLGNQYGVKVEIAGSEAYTDGRTIHIPSISLEHNEDILPLIRGYIDHEAGHIRYTDFEELRSANLDPFTHSIWNALEDCRIEHKMSEVFPGCKENFEWMIQKFFANTDSLCDSDNISLCVLNSILLTVRSWSCSDVASNMQKQIDICESHYKGLYGIIKPILDEFKQNLCDSIAYSIKIRDAIKSYIEEQQNDTDGDNNLQGSNKDGSLIEQDIDNTKTLQSLLDSISDISPDLHDLLVESIPSEISASKIMVAKEALPNQSELRPLSSENISKALQASVAMRYRLSGLLLSQKPRRSGLRRTGTLKTREIYKIAVGNQRVFEGKTVQAGINTAVHILFDTSGSMRKGLDIAQQTSFALAYVLSRQIDGINVALTAFPGSSLDITVQPILSHGSQISKNTCFLTEASGFTPLGPALLWCIQKMAFLPEKRKIILVLTDGEPDNEDEAHYAVNLAKKIGMEVYGIGIGDNSVSRFMESCVIKSVNDLAKTMFDMMQKALTIRG